MRAPHDPDASQFWHVRRLYWGLLGASLILALAIPVLLLCHASLTPLAARAYLSPATPRIGQPARLVVVLANPADRTATGGPWAQATVAWDMNAMSMHTRPLSTGGSARTPGVFSVPLVATMAGTWVANIAVQTPGRPVWHGLVHFTVMPPGEPVATTNPFTIPGALAACVLAVVERSAGG